MSKLTLFVSKFIPDSIERKVRSIRDKKRKFTIQPLPDKIFDDDLPKLKISFCTNCKGRLYHLKETLEKNILDNQDYPDVEFVLVNYNSEDGMHEWVKDNMSKYIQSGVLKYYFTPDPKFFHMSKAKNLAHRLASGDILCNLDGDNFTGKDFAFYINYLFNKEGMENIFHFKKAPYWGTEGRIVIAKDYFYELGGYDESFHPAGHQDHDFIERGKLLGLKYNTVEIENFLRYLSNSTKEKGTGLGPTITNYYKLRDENKLKSKRNLEAGKLVANAIHGFQSFKLYKNFSEKPIAIGTAVTQA